MGPGQASHTQPEGAAGVAAGDLDAQTVDFGVIAAARMRPRRPPIQPPTLSYSSSGSLLPNTSLKCEISVAARTRHWFSPSGKMESSSVSSNSSSMSPTICSSTSSMVTRPEMPPCSSMTMARWLRLTRNSRSSTFRRLDSGMKTAGRTSERTSMPGSSMQRSRSLASRMPMMLSRSPS